MLSVLVFIVTAAEWFPPQTPSAAEQHVLKSLSDHVLLWTVKTSAQSIYDKLVMFSKI